MNRPESIAGADSPAASARAGRIGVLIVNLGTPDATDAGSVRRYLREFLTDARVMVPDEQAQAARDLIRQAEQPPAGDDPEV